MPDDHCVLIVEDDAPTADTLVQCVRSLGMRSRVVTTLAEVDAAIAEGGFCCVLLDKQIPAEPDAVPLTSTGDTAQRRLRAVEPRRNANDHHLLPILIVTGASQAPAFIGKNYLEGASRFIPKPFTLDEMAAEILGALDRAGHADHAACTSLGRSAPPTPPVATVPEPPSSSPTDSSELAPLVRMLFDGVRIEQRMSFVVNGKRCDLQPARFTTLLRLGAERARGSLIYLHARDLGILRTPEIPSRIREAVEGAVPAGFSIIQRGEERMFRLHPAVFVEKIDWKKFENHPHAGIQAVAAAERKRR